MKTELFTIDFENHSIEVKADIDRESFGTYDTPGDNGSIEILGIKYMGADVLWLFLECDKEEEVIELIRKSL